MTNIKPLEEQLEQDTRTYLRSLQNARKPGKRFQIWLEEYIGEGDKPALLERHMDYMKDNDRLPMMDEDGCDTLVLLVGHSVEPLLQSIWAHEPDRLVLILSPSYYIAPREKDNWDGEQFYRKLKGLLRRLPPEKRKWWNTLDERGQPKLIPKFLTETTPAAVFRALLECVRTQRRVVIDITGAKKSMTAGAFLYAAYADVTVAYVDFDDDAYRIDFRAPYGYLCRIRHFSSPYQDFALRDWERVQQLYQRYRFREARWLLTHQEGIIAAMSGGLPGQRQAYFDPEQIERARTLVEVLSFYELWDAGDFQGAWKRAQELREQHGVNLRPLPTVVEELKDDWPRAKREDEDEESDKEKGTERIDAGTAARNLLETHEDLTQDYEGEEKHAQVGLKRSLFYQARRLVIYAEDELTRIERLIRWNEDYRSALLRAAGLNEVLLKSRTMYLMSSGGYPALEKGIDRVSARVMWRKLTGTPFGKRPQDRWPKVILDPADRMGKFWTNCAMDVETLITLRDKTVHTYLSIPQSLAEEALRIARCNLDEYEHVWMKRMGAEMPEVVVERLPWTEVCRLCGADQFLTPNLLDEEEQDERSVGC